jgi:acyl carrier protein
VCAAKIWGAWHLHQLTQPLPLDFFLLFSSVAAVWGSKGQSHYAAANSFLDGLAHLRQAQGLPAQSINWGAWGGGGMVTEGLQESIHKLGLRLLPADSLRHLPHWLGQQQAQSIVADVDWARFAPLYALSPQRAFLGNWLQPSTAPTNEPANQVTSQEPSKWRSEAELLRHVQEVVAQVLGYAVARVDPGRGLAEMGLDSMMAVAVQKRLQESVGVSLPPTLAFDYPTVAAIAGYLGGLVWGDTAAPEAAPIASSPTADAKTPTEADLAAELARLEALLL